MRGIAPAILIGIGVLHCTVGIVDGWSTITDMIAAGFWDSVSGADSQLFLWFMTAGIFLILLGQLGLWVERRLDRPLPQFLAWEIIAVTVVLGSAIGNLLFPAVLFVAAAAVILVRARRAARARSATVAA